VFTALLAELPVADREHCRYHRPSYDRVSPVSTAVIERAIQIECRADQRQVGEGLWEIAQRFALGTGLFGIESKMIGIPQHALE
jgi:hypothetical protein